MSAKSYNEERYPCIDGDVLAVMARMYQLESGLPPDGMLGPQTLASLRARVLGLVWPMLPLSDGRQPAVSSEGRWTNPSRPSHDGVDIMYRRETGDTQPVGPGQGSRRFVCPPVPVVAMASGQVVRAGKQPGGYRCWIEHEGPRSGYQTGYFHLDSMVVTEGDNVGQGQILGIVGAGQSGPAHLHLELSPAGRYSPMNPMLWLAKARVHG